MQPIKLISLLIVFTLISIKVHSQDFNVHTLIGKSQSDVIKKYGTPVHKDNSDPSMVCMFYKNATRTMVFVADRDGVYQAEATIINNNEQSARKQIDEFISSSQTIDFVTDTISLSDFRLHKTGVKADLQLFENKLTGKYEIRVKANRTEQ
ncbi:MAG: hypothetical protein R6W68_03075 [Ignavibacteriaceae bacterium]